MSIGNRASALVLAEDKLGCELLRSVTKRVALLRAVDATQADAFGTLLCETSIVSPSGTEMTGPVGLTV